MITLTERAKKELARLLCERADAVDSGLRLAVRRGGCAGWQYEMKWSSPEAGDEVQEKDGSRLIIDSASIEKLRGCEIDFSDELTDAGFKIHNPNASRSCGCGTSFDTSNDPAPPEEGSDECGKPS
ncbi:MAG: HesB/IscA family protein [Luteolibacter sp.]